jgi:hypothetical protein
MIWFHWVGCGMVWYGVPGVSIPVYIHLRSNLTAGAPSPFYWIRLSLTISITNLNTTPVIIYNNGTIQHRRFD